MLSVSRWGMGAGAKREFKAGLAAIAFVIFAALCIAVPMAQAQNTGTIVGSVYDKTGAVVPDASVRLINQATQDERKTVSNGEGFFTFGTVLPGFYTVKVEAKGFKSFIQVDLELRTTDKRQVIATLELGQATETVTVEARTDIIPVESGARSMDLTAADYEKLPMITRNAAELIRTLPGVITIGNGTTNGQSGGMDFTNVGNAQGSVGNGVSAAGAPYRGGTSLLMDGTNIIDEGCDCTSIALPNPDMISEVKVQTSAFTADNTKGPVVINYLTKSGGSKWHGSGYLYARNSIFNSNTWANDAAGIAKATGDHYYYPGFTVGGPVPKFNKKFFIFGGYEHFYQLASGGAILESYIPTTDMQAGNFGHTAANDALCAAMGLTSADNPAAAANNTMCASVHQGASPGFNGSYAPGIGGVAQPITTTQVPVDPAATALWSLMPKPNADPTTTPNHGNFYLPVPALHNGYVYRIRGDYNFDDNNKLFITWQYGNDTQPSQGNSHMWWLPGQSVTFPGGGLTAFTITKTANASFLHVFSPTLTNELVGYWTYFAGPQTPKNPSAVLRSTVNYPDSYGTVFDKGKPLGGVQVPGWNSPGRYSIPDFSQWDVFSGSGGSYYIKKQNPAVGDNVTKVVKTHSIKAGFYYEMTGNNQGNFNPYNGGFSFGQNSQPDAVTGLLQGTKNAAANFFMGIASNYNETNYLPLNDQAYKTFAFYAMDSWKVTRRVTVDYGFRFEHIGHWYDRAGFGNAVWVPGRMASDAASGKVYPGIYWHGIDPGIPLSGTPNRFLYTEPRFGLAFDVFGTGKTVVRGGWGRYRFNDQVNDYSSPLALAQQSITSTLGNNQTLLFSETGLAQKPRTTYQYPSNGAYILDPKDYEIPYSSNWNLSIDQRLPWNTVLDIAYEGSHSGSLFFGGQVGGGGNLGGGDLINVNKTPLGAYFSPDPITGVTPGNLENISGCTYGTVGSACLADYHPYGQYYGTNAVNVEEHKGYSNYNALQVIWSKQAGRFTFNTSFLWSKALGFGNNNIDPYNIANNYVVLNIDRPYVWSSSYSYDFGRAYKGDNKLVSGALNHWVISGFTTWQKGANLQAQTSQNLNLSLSYLNPDGSSSPLSQRTLYGTDANINVQPIETCDPTSGSSGTHLYNLSCFSAPAINPATLGHALQANGPRIFPYIHMPNYFQTDLAVIKTFHITERQTVEFRVSSTNWLNHSLIGFGGNALSLGYSTPSGVGTGPWTTSLTPTQQAQFGVAGTKYAPSTQSNSRFFLLGLKYSF